MPLLLKIRDLNDGLLGFMEILRSMEERNHEIY